MRATRQRITLLKNKINDELPDGNDIYGFEGVTKFVITSALDHGYAMLEALDGYSGRFEIIFLERKISDYYDKASRLLKKEDFEKEKEKFNDFLNIIQKIHFQIQETYILLSKEPIRTELELKKAKDSLIELETNLSSLTNIFNELSEIKKESSSFIDELKQSHESSIENEEKINSFLEEINNRNSEVQIASAQIATWEENIKNIKEELSNRSLEFVEVNKKIELTKIENEQNEKKIKELTEELSKQLKSNEKFQDEIQNTIADANRYGMAGSFKLKKDELTTPLIIWQISTIISITALIAISYFILQDVKAANFKWDMLIGRIPIFASCVWLGWFCAKQYGFTSRLREDYSYKYAVSMAFEGYKNATKELDEELLQKLLDTTIYNIANNPLNVYESKSNHGTPYHEFFEAIFKKYGSVKMEMDSTRN